MRYWKAPPRIMAGVAAAARFDAAHMWIDSLDSRFTERLCRLDGRMDRLAG